MKNDATFVCLHWRNANFSLGLDRVKKLENNETIIDEALVLFSVLNSQINNSLINN